jgi:chromosome segregation ATPase
MTIEELHGEMQAGFERIENRLKDVDKRLDGVDKRFDRVDKQFEDVDKRFQDVDKRFQDVDRRFQDVDRRFEDVDKRFKSLAAGIRADLKRELKRHEDTLRTHFNVMVERMQESVKIVAEATAHHVVRLDGHETRIKRLESPRRR